MTEGLEQVNSQRNESLSLIVDTLLNGISNSFKKTFEAIDGLEKKIDRNYRLTMGLVKAKMVDEVQDYG